LKLLERKQCQWRNKTKQTEANKAQSGAKMTTNLTAMVATYLVMGGIR
jgi:hypothetical protein